MGTLKNIVAQNIKKRRWVKDRSNIIYSSYYDQFVAKEGKKVRWFPHRHPYLKCSQDMIIESVFQHHVILLKIVNSVDGNPREIRHSVSFSSIFAGEDRIEFLEGRG